MMALNRPVVVIMLMKCFRGLAAPLAKVRSIKVSAVVVAAVAEVAVVEVRFQKSSIHPPKKCFTEKQLKQQTLLFLVQKRMKFSKILKNRKRIYKNLLIKANSLTYN